MHDELLEIAIKDAGETFEPPWLDVRAVTKRGRRRWWLTRPAAAATALALLGGSAVAVSRVDPSRPETTRREVAAAPAFTWRTMAEAPIAGRQNAVSAWTGEALLVWGGQPLGAHRGFLDGAAYDPASDSWTPLPRSPLRTSYGREGVWTGEELIVWGGEHGDGSHVAPDTGAAFNPATGKWRRLPPSPYWSLAGHTLVWTGEEMIAWGGVTSNPTTAASYDPATNEWTPLPQGPLGSRHGQVGLWTGEELIVWGGNSQSAVPLTGPEAAAFDPRSGTWRELPDAPLEAFALDGPGSVWTGSEMIVVGGRSTTEVTDGGAAYDPSTDEWRKIAALPTADDRDGAPIYVTSSERGVWTGTEVVFVTVDGVLSYSPVRDRWTILDAPDGARRSIATTAWTGTQLISWGGATWEDRGISELWNGGWIAQP